MTDNKGDLISREWLEDAFDNLCCHNCKMCRNFKIEDSFYKCNLIENAPTVPQVTVFAENASKEEIENFKQELEKVMERPQGDIRWTDKVSVKSNGDIIDFEGRVVGHINLDIMKGGGE